MVTEFISLALNQVSNPSLGLTNRLVQKQQMNGPFHVFSLSENYQGDEEPVLTELLPILPFTLLCFWPQ